MSLFDRRTFLGTLVAVALLAVAAPAFAGDDEIDEDAIPGEIHVEMKHPFVKFSLNGKEWDNHEYIKGNKTLIIRGVGRDDEHTLVLTPREGGYEPHTLTVAPSAFKRTVVKAKGKTRVLAFRANYKVDFTKTPTEKPAEPARP